MKVAHIFASNGSSNSGDFMLGIATKWHFENNIMKSNDVIYTDHCCRTNSNFTGSNIDKLNTYDCIIVGGGGLILPDTAPNKISAWQWIISKEEMERINIPIYVISIGYNLFNTQTINMSNNGNNSEDHSRLDIFKKNITTLINKATYFSMRHNGDIERLLEIIGKEYREKIIFQQCPSIDYMIEKWKPSIKLDDRKYIAIEIKDDREWRRYYKIGKIPYYNKLVQLVKKLLDEKKSVCYLSHDGSVNFYNFLKSKDIHLPILQCNTGNEKDILNKYSNVHTLLCSAGHSQMFSYAIGIRTISLISHPKLQYFCEDFNLLEDAVDINNNIDKLFQLKF